MKARIPKNMGGGAQNMNSMIKQAQKMQEDITKKQAEIDEMEFTASVGGGAVEVVMSGKKELKAITINAAKAVCLEDRIGSLEEGKDADIVLYSGDPLDVRSNIAHVFIDGKQVK